MRNIHWEGGISTILIGTNTLFVSVLIPFLSEQNTLVQFFSFLHLYYMLD